MTHIFPIVELSGLKNKKISDEKKNFHRAVQANSAVFLGFNHRKFCRCGDGRGGGGVGGSNYFVLQTAAKILRFKY